MKSFIMIEFFGPNSHPYLGMSLLHKILTLWEMIFPKKPVDKWAYVENPKWETQLLWEEYTALIGCGLNVSDLLKSVPVSWARIRKERDWVVPVRGCQSSVSSISLFLLRSLGMKQGMFSTRRPCLETWVLRDLSHSPQQHSTPRTKKVK